MNSVVNLIDKPFSHRSLEEKLEIKRNFFILFQGDSDEEQHSMVKDEYHIPVYLWAEHFSRPLKRRNRYMTCLINKEFVQTKGKYVFLDDPQIMGKTLDKLGIPNICGKVCKKFILNYTSIKFHNRKRTYEKSFKNSLKIWRKPIFHNKTQKLKISKESDSKLFKNFKCTNNKSQNSCELKNSSYDTFERNSSQSKNKDILLKNLYLNSKSEGKNVCICDRFSSPEKSHCHNKISSEVSIGNQLLKSSKTYNKADAKIKKMFTYKKTVRFNDEDLCSFAPSQHFKNDILPNESERLFDEFVSMWNSKESKNTTDLNEGKSINEDKLLPCIRHDNSNDHEKTVSKEVGSDSTYTHHKNGFKEKCSTITLNDEELDIVCDFATTTKSCLNNSTKTSGTEKIKNKQNEIMPTHLNDKFATNVVLDFKDHIQSSKSDNYTEVNKLSFEEDTSLTSNGLVNVYSNSEMDEEYKKNVSPVVRKIDENLFNKQSELYVILKNHKMISESQVQCTESEGNTRYNTSVETSVMKPAMKCAHDKLAISKQKVDSADELGDMKLPGNLLSNKINFNDVSVGSVSECLHKTNSLDAIREYIHKESISEDTVQIGNKNSILVGNTASKNMKNVNGHILLLGQDEHALPEQTKCKEGDNWNNSAFSYNTDLQISNTNKKITDLTIDVEGKSGGHSHRCNFNEEFTHPDSSDENDSIYSVGNRKNSVIINRQSDSDYDESDLEKNDLSIYSSSDISEDKMSAKEGKITDCESEDEILPSQTVKQKEYLILHVRKDKLNENDYSAQNIIRKENLSVLLDDSGTEILSCKNVKTRKTVLSDTNFFDVTDAYSTSEFCKNIENNKISETNALKLNIKPICDVSNVSKTCISENSIPGNSRVKSYDIHERDCIVSNSDSNINSEMNLKYSITDSIHLSRINLIQHKTINNEGVRETVYECFVQKDKENVLHTGCNDSEEITLPTQKEKMHISSPVRINVKHKMNLVSGKNILSENYCKYEINNRGERNNTSSSSVEFPQNDEVKQDELCKQNANGWEDTISKSETTEDFTKITGLKSFVSDDVIKGTKVIATRRAQGSNHIYSNKTNFKETEETEDKSKTEVSNDKDLATRKYCGTKEISKPLCSTQVSKGCTERKCNLSYSKQCDQKKKTGKKGEEGTKNASSYEDTKTSIEYTFKKDEKIDKAHSNTVVSRDLVQDISHNNLNEDMENMKNCVNKGNGEHIVVSKQLKSLTGFENQDISFNNRNYIQQSAKKNLTCLTVDKEESYIEHNINKEFSNRNLDENEPLHCQESKQDFVVINRQSVNEYEKNHLAGNNFDLTDNGIMKVDATASKSSESGSEDEIPPSQTIKQKGYLTPCIQKRDIIKSENNSYKKFENAPQKMNCYDKHTPEINGKEKSCVLQTKLLNDTNTERSSYKSATIRKTLFSPSLQACLLGSQLSAASENIQKQCTVSISGIIELKTKIHGNVIKNTDNQNESEYFEKNRMSLYDTCKKDNFVFSSERNDNIDTKFSVSDAINISTQNTPYRKVNNEELKASENMHYNQKTTKNRLNYDIPEKFIFSVANEKIHASGPFKINLEHNIPTDCNTKILPEVYKNCEQENKIKNTETSITLPLVMQHHENNKANTLPVLNETLLRYMKLKSNKSLKPMTDRGKNIILVPSSTSLKRQGSSLSNDKIKVKKICTSKLTHSKTDRLQCTSPMQMNKFTSKKVKANSVRSPLLETHKIINNEGLIGRGKERTRDTERTKGNSGLSCRPLNSHMVETNVNELKVGSSDSIILYKNKHVNNIKIVRDPSKVSEENNKGRKIYLTTDKIPLQIKNVDENYIPESNDSEIKCNRKSKYKHSDENKFIKRLKVSTSNVIKDSKNKKHVETTGLIGEKNKLVNEHNTSFKGNSNIKSKNVGYIQSNMRTKQSSYEIFDNNLHNFEEHDKNWDIGNACDYFERDNNKSKKNYKCEINGIFQADTEYNKANIVEKKMTTLLPDVKMNTDSCLPTIKPIKVIRDKSCNNPGHDTNENDECSSDGNGEGAKNSDSETDELIICTDMKKVGSTSTFRTDSVYTSLSDHLSDGDWKDRMDEVSNDSDDSYFLARMFDKPRSALRTLRTWDKSVDENMDKFTGLDCV